MSLHAPDTGACPLTLLFPLSRLQLRAAGRVDDACTIPEHGSQCCASCPPCCLQNLSRFGREASGKLHVDVRRSDIAAGEQVGGEWATLLPILHRLSSTCKAPAAELPLLTCQKFGFKYCPRSIPTLHQLHRAAIGGLSLQPGRTASGSLLPRKHRGGDADSPRKKAGRRAQSLDVTTSEEASRFVSWAVAALRSGWRLRAGHYCWATEFSNLGQPHEQHTAGRVVLPHTAVNRPSRLTAGLRSPSLPPLQGFGGGGDGDLSAQAAGAGSGGGSGNGSGSSCGCGSSSTLPLPVKRDLTAAVKAAITGREHTQAVPAAAPEAAQPEGPSSSNLPSCSDLEPYVRDLLPELDLNMVTGETLQVP